MKALLSLLTCIVLALCVAVPAPAQSTTDWKGAVFYDLVDKSTSAVAMRKLTTFDDVFSVRHWSVDLEAFAGSTFHGVPKGGFAIDHTWPLAKDDKLEFTFGVAGSIAQGASPSAGFVAALTVRF